MQTRTIRLSSPEATCQWAAALAPRLRAGDVILLSGDVGAGKTHFARCLIQSQLTTPEDVPSPTFTLVQTYPTPQAEIWHADLYRLSDVNEVFELGLTEAFSDAICLIEWPDRLGDLAPNSALSLSLAPGPDDDARIMQIRWQDAGWTDKLKGLAVD